MMDQQDQTQHYFRSVAGDWQSKSTNVSGMYSVIEGRNRSVLAVIQDVGGTKQRFLDIGCGTGQLVLAAASQGLEAEGIDFSEEMIAQCETNRRDTKLDACFTCSSFFDMTAPDNSYDVISAQGFIEYISPDQIEEFFARCFRLLRPGGALVIGSRNRLYNVFSLNEFTLIEMELGVLDALVAEAVALHTASSQDAAFSALRRCTRIYPHPDRHPATGINVNVRYQFSPADLIARLRKYGYTPKTLFPVHFHGLPPAIKAEHPEIHSQLAKLMGGIGLTDHRLVPFCSTFVLDVRKEPE